MNEYISLAEVRKRGLAPVHGATLTRWVLRGIKFRDQVIRLQAWRIGKKWFTTKEALAEFIAKTTPTFGEPEDAPRPRSESARQRAAEKATEKLIAMGC